MWLSARLCSSWLIATVIQVAHELWTYGLEVVMGWLLITVGIIDPLMQTDSIPMFPASLFFFSFLAWRRAAFWSGKYY